MELPPGGLVEGRRLPKRLRVNGGGPWYLAAAGTFERVGHGDLSLGNLQAVLADLGGRVFVSLPAQRSLQDYLGSPQSPLNKYVGWRLRRYEGTKQNLQPTVAAIARGAQVAVLPDLGIVWVDSHRLFRPGETVPLPWTEPLVEMVAIRSRDLQRAMRTAIGEGGPKRLPPPPD